MRLGLWGKGSRAEFIPAEVFCLPEPQLALFLNRLFATDGWATVLGEGQTQLGYALVSERLARQVQHLLLRFGILASLRRREAETGTAADRPGNWTSPSRRRCGRSSLVSACSARRRPSPGWPNGWRRSGPRRAAECGCRRRCGPIWSGPRGQASRGLEIATRAELPAGTNLHVGRRGLSRHRLRAWPTPSAANRYANWRVMFTGIALSRSSQPGTNRCTT